MKQKREQLLIYPRHCSVGMLAVAVWYVPSKILLKIQNQYITTLEILNLKTNMEFNKNNRLVTGEKCQKKRGIQFEY